MTSFKTGDEVLIHTHFYDRSVPLLQVQRRIEAEYGRGGDPQTHHKGVVVGDNGEEVTVDVTLRVVLKKTWNGHRAIDPVTDVRRCTPRSPR